MFRVAAGAQGTLFAAGGDELGRRYARAMSCHPHGVTWHLGFGYSTISCVHGNRVRFKK